MTTIGKLALDVRFTVTSSMRGSPIVEERRLVVPGSSQIVPASSCVTLVTRHARHAAGDEIRS